MKNTTLKPLTLSGRYFSKKELIQIQETVKMYPKLSRNELALTICEHFSWFTNKGDYKVISCLTALEKLEKQGFIKLPEKRVQKKRKIQPIQSSNKTNPEIEIQCPLDQILPLKLKIVKEEEEISLWNEYVERYHYLGYKHPIGASLKYFVISERSNQVLGCLMFSSSPWALADRDKWIGWNEFDRKKRLNLVVNNNRFLILPWVKVKNLASKVLSMLVKQIQTDWQTEHGYKPVLMETFVDSSQYSGTCYRAANWECVGQSSGKTWKDSSKKIEETSVKYIFVYPLITNFRAILKNEIKRNRITKIEVDEGFLNLWGKVVSIIAEVAHEFDQTWQKRKRVIDSLLLIFLIFRLLFSKNTQGYGTTISEFWNNCKKMKFPLPQDTPIAASAFSNARAKLDEKIFKEINHKIIEAYEEENKDDFLLKGHKIYAVDGSKINLPRSLINEGYKCPSQNTHYPQGLVSCLYQLKSRIPYDFDLKKHSNERRCALDHLHVLKKDDIVVYDRGYFSYAMLYSHIKRGIFPIFRLQRNTYKEIETFWNSDQTDQIITIMPSKDRIREILKDNPDIKEVVELKLRLVKYSINDQTYCIGTTLRADQFDYQIIKECYHARWGIEELYKISKSYIEVEDFHGKSERGVRQELFAHFVLITMNRLCSNESENLISNIFKSHGTQEDDISKVQVNFKNCLSTFSRHLEEIMLLPTRCINDVIKKVINSISRYRQKVRENRSYPRMSMKPLNKFRPKKG